MDSARTASLTLVFTAMALAVAIAMFVWGRDSIADDCERYGKFYRGEHAFECSPQTDGLPNTGSTHRE